MPRLLDPDAGSALIQESDEELLIRFRNLGDVAAFEALVRRYEKPIYHYLLRYLRNATMADDVLQTTLMHLYQHCDQFEAGRPIRPWLYSIASHLAIDALRREGRRHAESLDKHLTVDDNDVGGLVNVLQANSPSPLENLETQECAEWVRRAVDQLPDPLRLTLLLIYFQGRKYDEAAQILGVPVGTVKTHVHKALSELNAAWKRGHSYRS